MKNKKAYSLLIIIFSILVIILGTLLIYKNINNYKTKIEIKNSIITEEIKKENINDEIKYYQDKYNNNDIVGILKINGTKINSPIVHTTNNEYYLKHSLDKSYSVIGAPFIDYENTLISQQLNIYGHNSTKFEPPFQDLENYLDQNYYNNHNYIELKINNEKIEYEIFSVYIANKTSKEEHMKFKYTNEQDWLNHFIRLQNRSMYDNNLVLDGNDNIIVLQTCLFNEYNNKLLIIVGKRIF